MLLCVYSRPAQKALREVRLVNESQFEALKETPLKGPECVVAFGGTYVPPGTEDDVTKMPVVNLNAGCEGQPGDKHRAQSRSPSYI